MPDIKHECTQVESITNLTHALLDPEEGMIVQVKTIGMTVDSIKKDTEKIRYTLYGNGEPGVCENMRFCLTWIKRVNWMLGIAFIGAVGTFWWVIQHIITMAEHLVKK